MVESQSDEDGKKGSMDYGKIAKAIYKMMKYGTTILPPDINKSEITFTPIVEDNTILYGLCGISGINQDISQDIISGRPYKSFKHFYDYQKSLLMDNGVDENNKKIYRKTLVTPSKMVKLIQSGCFDCFNTDRIAVMKEYINYEYKPKNSLTLANLDKAVEFGCNLPEFLCVLYQYKKHVTNKQFFYCKDSTYKSKKHYILDKRPQEFFEKYIMVDMEEDKDYYYVGDRIVIIDTALEKALKPKLDKLKDCLNNKEILDNYNKCMFEQNYLNAVKIEDIDKWALETTCFYHNGRHELDEVDLSQYNITSFSSLPEEPIFEEKVSRNGRTWRRYALSRICGTVIGRKDNNHLVDILTPDNEVVTLNIPQGQFGYYKQDIELNGEFDSGYLKRGEMIIVSGYRRDDAFFVRKYANSIYKHNIIRIRQVNEDKTLTLQLSRLGADEE